MPNRMSDTLRASSSPITREAIARAMSPMSFNERIDAMIRANNFNGMQLTGNVRQGAPDWRGDLQENISQRLGLDRSGRRFLGKALTATEVVSGAGGAAAGMADYKQDPNLLTAILGIAGVVPGVRGVTRAVKPAIKKASRSRKSILDDYDALRSAERRTFGIKGKEDYIREAEETGNLIDAPFISKGPKISLEEARLLDEKLDITHEGTGYLPRNVITPEDLKIGSVLRPLVGDHMTAGQLRATRSGSLAEELGGGAPYMQNKKTGVWASMERPATNIQKIREKFPNQDIVGITTPMTHQSIDASKTVTDIFFKRFDPKVLPKNDIKRINDQFQNLKDFPKDFPGIQSKNLKEWMNSQTMKTRSAFVLTLDKSKNQKIGVPNFAEIRHAISRPDMRYTPSSLDPLVGYNLGTLDPTAPLRSVSKTGMPHGTYSHDIPGNYLGSFDVQLPRSVVFPTWEKSLIGRNLRGAEKQGSFRGGNIYEPVNQELIDNMMLMREKVLQNK